MRIGYDEGSALVVLFALVSLFTTNLLACEWYKNPGHKPRIFC